MGGNKQQHWEQREYQDKVSRSQSHTTSPHYAGRHPYQRRYRQECRDWHPYQQRPQDRRPRPLATGHEPHQPQIQQRERPIEPARNAEARTPGAPQIPVRKRDDTPYIKPEVLAVPVHEAQHNRAESVDSMTLCATQTKQPPDHNDSDNGTKDDVSTESSVASFLGMPRNSRVYHGFGAALRVFLSKADLDDELCAAAATTIARALLLSYCIHSFDLDREHPIEWFGSFLKSGIASAGRRARILQMVEVAEEHVLQSYRNTRTTKTRTTPSKRNSARKMQHNQNKARDFVVVNAGKGEENVLEPKEVASKRSRSHIEVVTKESQQEQSDCIVVGASSRVTETRPDRPMAKKRCL